MDISYRISIASRAACARSCLASFFEEARESDIFEGWWGLGLEVDSGRAACWSRPKKRDRARVTGTHSNLGHIANT